MYVPRIQPGPLWPLPSDYKELSKEGQRQARVAACRQWLRDLKHLPDCVRLFAHLYLVPVRDETGAVIFDPLFYNDWVPRPAFHDESIALHARYRFVAEVMPRGAAKTTELRLLALFKVVTRPGHGIVYTTASHRLAEITGNHIRIQLTENQLLNDDWKPEYGGALKPDRGDAPWSSDFFVLRNRAWLKTSSVQALQRGLRPDDYFLDDPEYDPSASTDMQITRDEMEYLILRVILPMALRARSRVLWRGTFISQRHFLWAVMQDTEIDGQKVAALPEFREWARRVIDVVGPDGRSIWPRMWPTDAEERAALGLSPDTPTLADIEKYLGGPAFMAEMRGRPGTGGPAYFGRLTREDHGYQWRGPVDLQHPITSQGSISMYRRTQGGNLIQVDIPVAEFLRQSLVFVTVDPAYTESPTADFKVAMVLAVTPLNELVVLDVWRSNRLPLSELVRQAFVLAERWGASCICPEKVREGAALVSAMMEVVRTQALAQMGVARLVAVRPVHPGTASKKDRIASLLWRFSNGLIKLPLAQVPENFVPLLNQIRDFNPNAPDGGLTKDDDIDALSMAQAVVRTPRERVSGVVPRVSESLQRLRQGHRTDRWGFPIIFSLPTQELTDEDLKCLNATPPNTTIPEVRLV